MNWRSTGGKSGLVKMLMHEHGFSKRRAEKAVNAVFDCMIGALKRGEGVEIPVGRIRAVRAPANRQRSVDQKFRNIQNQVLFSRLVQHPQANHSLLAGSEADPPRSGGRLRPPRQRPNWTASRRD